ncbi:peptidoglycan D,D-transpeptidase FtsI family protein [Xylanibacillus composti]|uniref:Penicillin-binding protein n=1 Tax=Xylanibacillus composti TaxID=1572762 RepID=A0A8J4H2T1_9BACL|nr:penicillin-binding transpeptidase domain-containing protein [Xylanibacillus composti]GIQ68441.1 penicillin-binding protein [Xylanibacillus composti]
MTKQQERDPQKQEIIRQRHFAFRLNVFFFCIFVLFSVLIVRLAFLQFVEGEELRALKDRKTTRSTPIPPIRGNIYDRNGFPIAQSVSTQSLYYRVQQGQNQDEVIALANRLANLFASVKESNPKTKTMTAEQIIEAMDVNFDINKQPRTPVIRYSEPRRIKTDLTKEEIAYLVEHRDEFSDLEIMEESVREYAEITDGPPGPDGSVQEEHIAVQLVGYLKEYRGARDLEFYKNNSSGYLETETVGVDGLELMYQERLRGQNGAKIYQINAAGKIVPGEVEVIQPIKGDNLYLTIDAEVQLATQRAIVENLDRLKNDPVFRSVNKTGTKAMAGYAVAMEVAGEDAGKVVAMASYPDYDPEVWRGGRISQSDLDEIQLFMRNGTIWNNWAPVHDDTERGRHPGSLVYLGSTMKPLTILVGLNEGLIKPNTVFNDRGRYEFGRDGSSIRNSDGRAQGNLTPASSLVRSSNVYMAATVGEPLFRKYGRSQVLDVWDSYMEQFGLGVRTGSGLPGEIAGTKDYMDVDAMGSELASMVFSSFGQGGRYTALQLAQYTGVLATEGKRLRPFFVNEVRSADSELLERPGPDILNEVDMPQEYWDVVKEGMMGVRMQGFEGFPYPVASKTGTSEQSVAGATVENAVYIAYAPADKPKLAVAVVVPGGGYGSYGAAPIARRIFDAYDKVYGLYDKDPDAPAGNESAAP